MAGPFQNDATDGSPTFTCWHGQSGSRLCRAGWAAWGAAEVAIVNTASRTIVFFMRSSLRPRHPPLRAVRFGRFMPRKVMQPGIRRKEVAKGAANADDITAVYP